MAIELDRVRGILRRGGMAVPKGELLEIYRTRDARRGYVAEISRDMLDALIAAGDVAEMKDMPGRWHWAARSRGARAARPVVAPLMPAKAKRTGKVLARVLNSVSDEHERRRLSKAASRFLGDTEAISRGTVRVMSWEFIPRGQGAKAQGGRPGFADTGLIAHQNLDRLQARIGPRKMAMLEALIVREMSTRQIEHRFSLLPKEVLPAAKALLQDLADAYDLVIRRVPD